MHVIAGRFKGRKLKTPSTQKTRPTPGRLKEALFNICQHIIDGIHFLDTFAGSGAMAIEAISRGARHATLIEQDPDAIRCIKDNIDALDISPLTTIIADDVTRALERLAQQNASFNIIYCDPPYQTTASQAMLNIIDTTNLLAPQGRLFIEESDKQPLNTDNLQTLVHAKTRKAGSSTLHEYHLKR
ncbi:16S rRNA (guanine(966)-N(2))-methyltransferase RsmD [Simkania negevensis]|uniref:16S rRNA (Guanine(966)-N(2))-methyltransferase RsmD n=1 Tax=Simkania negevensis TaxID=83561 RepID=A0ABS3AS92_9BACT|nr:16S rRNA (guanine(966)-N(2))-methyltransferase RsmD [Simkania negevensis]